MATCQSRANGEGVLTPLSTEEELADIVALLAKCCCCCFCDDGNDQLFFVGLTTLAHQQPSLGFMDRPRPGSSTTTLREAAVPGQGFADGSWPDDSSTGGTALSDAAVQPVCAAARLVTSPIPGNPLSIPTTNTTTTTNNTNTTTPSGSGAGQSLAGGGAVYDLPPVVGTCAAANNLTCGGNATAAATSSFRLELNLLNCDGGPTGQDGGGAAAAAVHAFVCRVPLPSPSPPPPARGPPAPLHSPFPPGAAVPRAPAYPPLSYKPLTAPAPPVAEQADEPPAPAVDPSLQPPSPRSLGRSPPPPDPSAAPPVQPPPPPVQPPPPPPPGTSRPPPSPGVSWLRTSSSTSAALVMPKCDSAVLDRGGTGRTTYLACHVAVTWSEAAQLCGALLPGGALAAFESQAQMDAVARAFGSKDMGGSYDFWVGLVSGASTTEPAAAAAGTGRTISMLPPPPLAPPPPPLEWVLTDPRVAPELPASLWRSGKLTVHDSCKADPPPPEPPRPPPAPPSPPFPRGPSSPLPPTAPSTTGGSPARRPTGPSSPPPRPVTMATTATPPPAGRADPPSTVPPAVQLDPRPSPPAVSGAVRPVSAATLPASSPASLSPPPPPARAIALPRAGGCCAALSLAAAAGAASPSSPGGGSGGLLELHACYQGLKFICQAPTGGGAGSPEGSAVRPNSGGGGSVGATSLLDSLFLDALVASYGGDYRVFRAQLEMRLVGASYSRLAAGDGDPVVEGFRNQTAGELAKATRLPAWCYSVLGLSSGSVVAQVDLTVRALPRASLANFSDFVPGLFAGRSASDLFTAEYISAWEVQDCVITVLSVSELTAAPSPPPDSGGGGGSNTRIIIVSALVGGVVFMVGVVGGVVLIRRWRARRADTPVYETPAIADKAGWGLLASDEGVVAAHPTSYISNPLSAGKPGFLPSPSGRLAAGSAAGSPPWSQLQPLQPPVLQPSASGLLVADGGGGGGGGLSRQGNLTVGGKEGVERRSYGGGPVFGSDPSPGFRRTWTGAASGSGRWDGSMRPSLTPTRSGRFDAAAIAAGGGGGGGSAASVAAGVGGATSLRGRPRPAAVDVPSAASAGLGPQSASPYGARTPVTLTYDEVSMPNSPSTGPQLFSRTDSPLRR